MTPALCLLNYLPPPPQAIILETETPQHLQKYLPVTYLFLLAQQLRVFCWNQERFTAI